MLEEIFFLIEKFIVTVILVSNDLSSFAHESVKFQGSLPQRLSSNPWSGYYAEERCQVCILQSLSQGRVMHELCVKAKQDSMSENGARVGWFMSELNGWAIMWMTSRSCLKISTERYWSIKFQTKLNLRRKTDISGGYRRWSNLKETRFFRVDAWECT